MKKSIHEFERGERRGRRALSLASLLLAVVLAGTWLGLFSFLGASAAFGTFTTIEDRYLPDPEGMDLDLPDLSRLSRVYTQDNVVLAELHDGKNSEPVRLDEVPEHVVTAVLAAEDSDFFEHEGIDFSSIMRAAINNAQGGRRQGGSTITQQVVKQNFVGAEQSIERKISEAVLAAELERRYSKEQILEYYLNSVYFGSGAYGIKAAAREFLGKNLEELTLAEATMLATLVRNPALYDPRGWPERVEERRNAVLESMVVDSLAERSEIESAKREPLEIIPHTEFDGPADHVVAEVKRRLLHDPDFAFLGETYTERKRAVFGCPADDTECEGGGGLRIVVTIDLGLQNEANRILQEWLPQPEDPEQDAPTGAIATVDSDTGAVLVMASGLPFDEEQFDLATQGRRQAGSAFKPFTLVAALEQGWSLGSRWDSTSPQEIECGFPCAPDGSSIWKVHNADRASKGLISLMQATQGSVNAVYAQVAVAVGPENIVDVAHRMGIESSLPPVYSLTLGTGETTPLEMASAFTNFATNGVHADPYLIERIETAAGEVIYDHEPEREQVIDPRIAGAARTALEQVVCCGTATRARIDRPQFGKTGTHQNFNDAWFVGGVRQLSTAVWVGFPDAQIPLRNVWIRGERYSRVFGGSVPAPIWREFMQLALADRPVEEFPAAPEGTSALFQVPKTEVPDVSGMSLAEAKTTILKAKLQPVVKETPSYAAKGTLIGLSPRAGSSLDQGSTVSLLVSSGRPPEAPVPDFRWTEEHNVAAAVANFVSWARIDVSYSIVYKPWAGDPNLIGRVVAISPGPGTVVKDGAHLTVTVATPPPPPPPAEEGGEGDG